MNQTKAQENLEYEPSSPPNHAVFSPVPPMQAPYRILKSRGKRSAYCVEVPAPLG